MKHLTRIVLVSLLMFAGFADASAQNAPAQQQPAAPAASTEKPAESPAPEEKAIIYVYRTSKAVGAALEPSVFCDGVEVARMDNGRFFMLKLEPGEHRIHMTDKNKRVDLKLGRGETAYVRVKIEFGMMKGRGTVSLADEEDAVKEIKKLKPLGEDKIKDRTMVAVGDAASPAATKKSP